MVEYKNLEKTQQDKFYMTIYTVEKQGVCVVKNKIYFKHLLSVYLQKKVKNNSSYTHI